MNDLELAYRDRALAALDAARFNLDHDDAATAINRGYYACFYAAQAALASVGEAPKTHTGVHRRFSERFVSEGRVSREVGRILGDAFRIRQQTDYDVFAVADSRSASDLVADAARFVAAALAFLDPPG